MHAFLFLLVMLPSVAVASANHCSAVFDSQSKVLHELARMKAEIAQFKAEGKTDLGRVLYVDYLTKFTELKAHGVDLSDIPASALYFEGQASKRGPQETSKRLRNEVFSPFLLERKISLEGKPDRKISIDGSLMLDHTGTDIRVTSLQSRAEVAKIQFTRGRIQNVEASADLQIIAAEFNMPWGTGIRVHRSFDPEPFLTIDGQAPALSPDGSRLSVLQVVNRNSFIDVYDTSSGQRIGPTLKLGRDVDLKSSSISADNKILMLVKRNLNGEKVLIYDLATGKKKISISGRLFLKTQLSSATNEIFLLDYRNSKTVFAYDLNSGQPLRSYNSPHDHTLKTFEVSPEGTSILGLTTNAEVIQWQPSTGYPLHHYAVDPLINFLSFVDSDSKLIAWSQWKLFVFKR